MSKVATMPNTETSDLLSVVQVAETLRMSPRTVRYWIKSGSIAATKLGEGTSAYVIARSEVERIKSERAAS